MVVVVMVVVVVPGGDGGGAQDGGGRLLLREQVRVHRRLVQGEGLDVWKKRGSVLLCLFRKHILIFSFAVHWKMCDSGLLDPL